jgi:heavy metal translocating P-type ATPase
MTPISIILLLIIIAGVVKIVADSYEKISIGKYSLDYIAFFAMALSLYSGEYLAGAIVSIMFIGGESLEAFASGRAHRALQKLGETIPKNCLVSQSDTQKDLSGDTQDSIHKGVDAFTEQPIQQVVDGQIILVKRNEIVPLDGTIVTPDEAVLNLAHITGEVDPVNFKKGTFVRSGSINSGNTMTLSVVGSFATSSYQRIVNLVEEAKMHPAKTVRLSEKANLYFTFITVVLAGLTYYFTGDLVRLLAVLVIATPCPLIIAAPVAFVGGMSIAANRGIILRKPSALEGLDKADTIFFDKTGTLTLGLPVLLNADTEYVNKGGTNTLENGSIKSQYISDESLAIAAGLEIHSLHPYAKTIVEEARKRGLNFPIADHVHEEIGKGISGTIHGKEYHFYGKELLENSTHSSVDGVQGGVQDVTSVQKDIVLARFQFGDVMKTGADELLSHLKEKDLRVAVITGDTKEKAEQTLKDLHIDMYTDQKPEEKYALVDTEKKKGHTVVMVGDGLNDAPALAKADVGIVFSGTENGASIEAADVAILGGGLDKLQELFTISHRTIRIAKQSIYGGIGLSVVGMAFASLGLIHPVYGALIQEGIDVVVILNALRTLRGGK